jgi:ubiquinone/menaquinone biosynthesis C-methylase UbiE
MQRVLEPEVMDTPEEAADYDAMDHSVVNQRFCEDLLRAGELRGAVLDIGTGTALIPITLCELTNDVTVVAIDLATHMLAKAKENVQRLGLEGRIQLQKVDAKGLPFRDGEFRAVVSNSIIHHIPDPRTVLAESVRVAVSGGLVFIRDLCRPEDDAEVDRLVALYAANDNDQQRMLFHDSLKAALTIDEVRAFAKECGFSPDVRMTSDRHWTLTYVKP